MRRSLKASEARAWGGLALALLLWGCTHAADGRPRVEAPDAQEAPRACEAPKVQADGGCCWPGQAWSEPLGCQGPPACPADLRAVGLDCLPAELVEREACESQDGPACLRLAALYEQRQAWPEARGGWERACELGLPEGCQALAQRWAAGMPDADADASAECGWWVKACEAGAGCVEAGRCRWEGDRDESLELWERGCELGEAAACEARTERQGELCASGEAPWEDASAWARALLQGDEARAPDAARLLRAACTARWGQASTDAPDLGACEDLEALGSRLEAADAPLALELWEVGCLTRWDDLGWEGDPRSCERLGGAKLAQGAWGEAGEHLGRACQGMSGQPGAKRACERLWSAGAEREKAGDLESAGKLHGHGCSAQHPKNCKDAGRTWRGRNAGQRADAKAARWMEQGCDYGDWGACALLGGMMEEGRGVEQNVAGAADLYERACDLGREWSACASLGGLYLAGRGVELDEQRGAALLKRACQGGWKAACGRK